MLGFLIDAHEKRPGVEHELIREARARERWLSVFLIVAAREFWRLFFRLLLLVCLLLLLKQARSFLRRRFPPKPRLKGLYSRLISNSPHF